MCVPSFFFSSFPPSLPPSLPPHLEHPDRGRHVLGQGDLQGGIPFVVHEGGVGSFLQERERGREGRAERSVVGVEKAATNGIRGTE